MHIVCFRLASTLGHILRLAFKICNFALEQKFENVEYGKLGRHSGKPCRLSFPCLVGKLSRLLGIPARLFQVHDSDSNWTHLPQCQNLLPVKTPPWLTEAIPEMVFNRPKRDNFLTLNFGRKTIFSTETPYKKALKVILYSFQY